MPRPRNTLEAARLRDAMHRRHDGAVIAAALSGLLVRRPGRDVPRPPSLHFCLFDRECRSYGAPRRIYAGLFDWSLTIALTPSARLSSWPGAVFSLWGWVVLERGSARTCGNVSGLDLWEHATERLVSALRTCPLRRGHRGGCLDWLSMSRVDAPVVTVSPLVVEPIDEVPHLRALDLVESLLEPDEGRDE